MRTAIYYELSAARIEIPYPIQVEYSREEAPADSPERRERFRATIAAVPVLAKLPEEATRRSRRPRASCSSPTAR